MAKGKPFPKGKVEGTPSGIITVYQQTWQFGGTWRWQLKSVNGRILADSGEAYVQKAEALKAAERMLAMDLSSVTLKVATEPLESAIPNRGLEDMPIRILPVKIIKPKENKVVRGIIDITVQVAKPTEIVKVELAVDAILQGVVTVPKKDKFLFQLDTRELITGSSYSLYAVAYSKTGERFTSPRVNIRVGN